MQANCMYLNITQTPFEDLFSAFKQLVYVCFLCGYPLKQLNFHLICSMCKYTADVKRIMHNLSDNSGFTGLGTAYHFEPHCDCSIPLTM